MPDIEKNSSPTWLLTVWHSAQHPQLLALHLPPGSFNSETQRTPFFPRASFSSESSPYFSVLFSLSKGEKPSIISQEDDSICLGIPMRCFTAAFHKLIIFKAPLGSGGWEKRSFGEDLCWHEWRTAQTSRGKQACLNTSNLHSQVHAYTQCVEFEISSPAPKGSWKS